MDLPYYTTHFYTACQQQITWHSLLPVQLEFCHEQYTFTYLKDSINNKSTRHQTKCQQNTIDSVLFAMGTTSSTSKKLSTWHITPSVINTIVHLAISSLTLAVSLALIHVASTSLTSAIIFTYAQITPSLITVTVVSTKGQGTEWVVASTTIAIIETN